MKVQNGRWFKRLDVSDEASGAAWEDMGVPGRVVNAMRKYGYPLLSNSLSAERVEAGPWDNGRQPMDESWYEVLATLEFQGREGKIVVKLASKDALLRDALSNLLPFAVYGVPDRVVLPHERPSDDNFTLNLAARFMSLNSDALTPRSGVEVQCAVSDGDSRRTVTCGYSVVDFGEGHFGQVWEEAGFSSSRWVGTVGIPEVVVD